MKAIRLSWDQKSRELIVYRDLGAGLAVSARVTNTTYSSFNKLVFTANGFTASEQPLLDDIVIKTMQDGLGAQADILAGFANEMWGFPRVEAFFAYELLEEPRYGTGNSEAFYGLCSMVRNATNTAWQFGTRKPAFCSYQTMIQELGSLPSTGDIVVDNSYLSPAAQITNTRAWVSADTDSGYYFDGYLHDNNSHKGTASVRFNPVIPTTGTYIVSMRYPASGLNSSSVPVTITHAGGSAQVAVNQQQNGGKWVILGTYQFNAGEAGAAGSVEIRNQGTTGRVVADAVRFHRQ